MNQLKRQQKIRKLFQSGSCKYIYIGDTLHHVIYNNALQYIKCKIVNNVRQYWFYNIECHMQTVGVLRSPECIVIAEIIYRTQPRYIKFFSKTNVIRVTFLKLSYAFMLYFVEGMPIYNFFLAQYIRLFYSLKQEFRIFPTSESGNHLCYAQDALRIFIKLSVKKFNQ